MHDRVFWNYLEELPEQEAAWKEWQSGLTGWHRFNAFYTHYLRVEGRRVKLLKCTELCGHNCPRRIIEDSPSNIMAVCPRDNAVSIQLKFRDILIYSLRRDEFHKAICTSLQIERVSGSKLSECRKAWYLGEHSGTAVYLTYRTMPSDLAETTASLCFLHQEAFVLMIPTVKNITPEIQQLMAKNNSVLFSMESELTLQPDGSFKPKRGMAEYIKSYNHFLSEIISCAGFGQMQ